MCVLQQAIFLFSFFYLCLVLLCIFTVFSFYLVILTVKLNHQYSVSFFSFPFHKPSTSQTRRFYLFIFLYICLETSSPEFILAYREWINRGRSIFPCMIWCSKSKLILWVSLLEPQLVGQAGCRAIRRICEWLLEECRGWHVSEMIRVPTTLLTFVWPPRNCRE